jgi:oligoendopeptidase F
VNDGLRWPSGRSLAAWVFAGIQVVLAVLAVHAAASATELPERWDLRDLYPTPQAWSDSYQRTRATIAALDRYQGTLGGGAQAMYTALAAISGARREAWRLLGYASLLADEDLRVAANVERKQQARSLFTELDEKTSWVAPEVQALGAEKLRGFLAQMPDLRQRFDFYLLDTLRQAPHTLPPEGEALLAATGDMQAQPYGIYQQLVGADFPYPTIEIGGGKVRLGQPEYEKYRSAADGATRKAVFDAFWGAFGSYQGTLGATLTAKVMGDVFTSRARRFDSSLHEALFADNMPDSVYRALVAQANAALPTLHRYLKLRRRLLGIDGELAYYDNYPPLFTLAEEPRFTMEQSRRITLAALAPLGDEYLALLRKGAGARWTDTHPRVGKASGGYVMGGAYDVHPYMLLNHNDDYESLSTFAHEWGHALHTLLANAAQPFEKAPYSSFIGETAAITNQMLLGDYLARTAATPAEKLYFLGAQLEEIRTTFFRQVQFAEFQLAINEARERGEPLSGASLSESYCELLKRYYGAAQGVMTIDPLYCNEWAYVPHFYMGYYVWQYATSMVGAAQFAEQIQDEGAPARQRYLALLQAGGSNYPYDLYRRAGIDLAQPAPYRALFRRMERIMDEIEAVERAGR